MRERNAYCMSSPHPGPPPPPHPVFFSEWLCTVLGLLIPLGERIIFSALPHRQGLLESQLLHFSAHRCFYGLKKKFPKFVAAVLRRGPYGRKLV